MFYSNSQSCPALQDLHILVLHKFNRVIQVTCLPVMPSEDFDGFSAFLVSWSMASSKPSVRGTGMCSKYPQSISRDKTSFMCLSAFQEDQSTYVQLTKAVVEMNSHRHTYKWFLPQAGLGPRSVPSTHWLPAPFVPPNWKASKPLPQSKGGQRGTNPKSTWPDTSAKFPVEFATYPFNQPTTVLNYSNFVTQANSWGSMTLRPHRGRGQLPEVLVPFAAQHSGDVVKVLQLAGGQEGGAIQAAAEVLLHVLLLQDLQDVVHLQHRAQTLLLHLHLHGLLTPHHLLLRAKQLRQRHVEEEKRLQAQGYNTTRSTKKAKAAFTWSASNCTERQVRRWLHHLRRRVLQLVIQPWSRSFVEL